jgi:hypothetical protein
MRTFQMYLQYSRRLLCFLLERAIFLFHFHYTFTFIFLFHIFHVTTVTRKFLPNAELESCS